MIKPTKEQETDRETAKFIKDIIDRFRGEEYIFRGESRDFAKPVSSGLYRKFCLGEKAIDDDIFSVVSVEEDIVNKISPHFSGEARNIDKLTQLQHHGGKTALIDFSYNLHIALFFACDGHFTKPGFLYFFKKSDFDEREDIKYPGDEKSPVLSSEELKAAKKGVLVRPTGKNPRVIFQSSVFVHNHLGYLSVDDANKRLITRNIKQNILEYLDRYFNINADTVYNDLHGFIQNQDNHSTAEAEFYRGETNLKGGRVLIAIDDYSNAIEKDPRYAEAYYKRGEARVRNANQPKYLTGNKSAERPEILNLAKADYQKALEINPEYEPARRDLEQLQKNS